jgi:quinol monooxygenase YgiN
LRSMILSVLKLTVVREKRQAAMEILRTMERRTRGKLGCIDCGVYERQGDDGDAILYLEKWSSKEDLYRHIKSDSFMLVLTVMEFASQEPEIYFHEIPETGRLELIKTLRSREQANE